MMARVRRHGTAPELVVRSVLCGLGFHYRLNAKDLPGTPDIVHRGRKKAIFVHGCFWHHHSGCRKGSLPKRNVEFWKEKLARNVARDRRAVQELRRSGFDVLIIWECETLAVSALAVRLQRFWVSR